ncbi:TPA: hypothetical protein ACT5B2_000815 [Burkholderia cenocepacia]|uniref:hypothetical protein n=1 Tax=Burkholderia cenocepacia TaxID=95486 RepID=UPI00054DA0C5|nr:hypothetical protein [Burkholderia cenocepacia]
MFQLLNMSQDWMLIASTAPLYEQYGNQRTRKYGLVYGLKSPGCGWMSVDVSRPSKRENFPSNQ